MSTEQHLIQRADACCELCKSDAQLSAYCIPPDTSDTIENCLLLCHTCREQIESDTPLDQIHWRCLNESMWSQVPAVQVMAWRQLNRLSEYDWAQDLMEMLYLDDDLLAWAKAEETNAQTEPEPTLDSNGSPLSAGDTVTLIKDLVVKGAGFTAKRGTPVRNIALTSNPSQIEGKVNGTRIVLLAEYLKKSN